MGPQYESYLGASPAQGPGAGVGHAAVAQAVLESESLPTQFAPPCAGAGLVQVRVLVRVPVWPHAVAVHASSAPQLDQPPLTGCGVGAGVGAGVG